MRKNEKGFTAVELILAIVVVALLGFGGWYAWQAKNNPNSTQSPPSKQNMTAKVSDYTSTELGLSLRYPTEWGVATLSEGPLSKYQSGKYRQLSFSKATNISVNFVTGPYSSPLDACGYDDPVQNALHAQNAKQASVIGWEAGVIKRYMTGQGFNGPTVYKEYSTSGNTGPGWTEVGINNKVLVYKDIDKVENRVKVSDGEGCSPVTQAQADAANAFLSFYHYAANYSNDKVYGINSQFDARKGDDSSTRASLVTTLNSIK